MEQENDTHQPYHDALLEQRGLEGRDGVVDELGAVVDRNDLGPCGQTRSKFGQPLLDVLDDVERVRSEALQGDAARDLAFAVELGHTSTLVGAELDTGDVAHQDRRAALRLQHDVLDVGEAAQVPATPHHELELRHLDRATAHIHVAGTHGLANFGEGYAEASQPLRVDDDVVLLDEAADARDLRHPLGLRERIADGPVLERAQLRQRPVLRDDRILVDPADAGGIGPERRRHSGRKPAPRRAEVFEYARARPVDVGAVLEDHVDEGHAEEREPPHHARPGHRQHGGRERIGDLVLDHLGCLPGIFGVDDDLRVREIGDGVERQVPECVEACRDREYGADQDQHDVPGRTADEPRDHGACSEVAKPFRAALRLLSASIRKLAETTTASPSATPSRTSTKPLPRRPGLTSRGSNRPSLLSTSTTWRVPVSMMALSGTVRTGAAAPVAISTSTYMSGRSRSSLLTSSIRRRAVRVSRFRCG